MAKSSSFCVQEQVGNNYDSARHEKTAAALQIEIARLEAAQFIQRTADTALDSLKGKIAVLKARPHRQMHRRINTAGLSVSGRTPRF